MSWDNDTTIADAARALRARGVNTVDDLLEVATPTEILAACHRWDAETDDDKTPGLIVHWIRKRQFEAPAPSSRSKAAQQRARFDEYAARYPVGSVAESHAELVRRRWPEDWDRARERDVEICPGDMYVIGASYPVLEMQCDECDIVTGLGPRHLHVLDGRR